MLVLGTSNSNKCGDFRKLWIGKPLADKLKKFGREGQPAIIGFYFRQGLVLNAVGVLFKD